MLENIYKKRFQIQTWNNKIPSKKLINSLLKKTYELVPSKQNVIPYKIVIWGPDVKKDDFRDFCRYGSGDMVNDFKKGTSQLLAPYVLFFCTREINDINGMVLRTMKKGHEHSFMEYKDTTTPYLKRLCLEIGMFSTLLTGFCMEENLNVSYTLCMPSPNLMLGEWKSFGFGPGEVIFCMSIGYSDQEKSGRSKDEIKPRIENIVNWVK